MVRHADHDPGTTLAEAIFGWIILGETLDLKSICQHGYLQAMAGIALAMFRRDKVNRRVTTSKPLLGILFAFGGAFGQALGIVFSKIYGMQNYDPFAATQIRIITGIAGFIILVTTIAKMGFGPCASAILKLCSRSPWFHSSVPFLGVFIFFTRHSAHKYRYSVHHSNGAAYYLYLPSPSIPFSNIRLQHVKCWER